MKKIIRILPLLAVFSLSACAVKTGCDNFHGYRYTKVQAPVKVPTDLEQPVNESTAPDAQVADPTKIDRNAAGECLEKPPKL